MDAVDLQQSSMILNALKNGWTVSMNNTGELVFTKDKERMTPEETTAVISEGFSSKFLQSLIKKRVKD